MNGGTSVIEPRTEAGRIYDTGSVADATARFGPDWTPNSVIRAIEDESWNDALAAVAEAANAKGGRRGHVTCYDALDVQRAIASLRKPEQSSALEEGK